MDVLGPASSSRGRPDAGRPGDAVGQAMARELGLISSRARSLERGRRHDKLSNTSVHVGPDGEVKAVYRKLHMFDVEVDGVLYKESDHEQPGSEMVVSELASGVGLGMSICYDVRFPELYRQLAVPAPRCSRAERLHARDHARPLGVAVRARAIENQCFVIAPNQIGSTRGGYRSGGRSLIVDPGASCWRRRPTPKRRSWPTSTSTCSVMCAGAYPRSRTAGPTSTEARADGSSLERSGRQAAGDP